MKVVHIASGDTWGGAERVLALLAEDTNEQAACSVEVLLFNEGRLADRLRSRGVEVDVIPESKLSFPRLACAVRRWLDGRRPDVVHAHRYKEILATALAIAPRKRGFVATVHGLEPSQQLTRSRAVLIWSSLVAAKLVGAQVVTVSSELTHRLQRVLGHKRIVRIPNPMPPVGDSKQFPDLRQKFGWTSSRPLVGFVGRLEKVKGPDIFVEVAARCQTDAGFVLVGGGSLARELSAHVTAAGLTGRVAFLGEVPDAAPYIRQFDVLALPSRHEGLPLVLLEAAASAVPVVAFEVGGVREVLHRSGPGARLVAPADENAFRAAVEAFLRDPERSRLEATQGAESIRAEFSLATIASAYRDIYRIAARSQEFERSHLA
jgi:L-malate glycosyltransferase